MIIQFNLLYSEMSRRLGSKIFYHYNTGTIPNDQEIVDLLSQRYMNDYACEYDSPRRLFITYYGRRWAEVFPIFCSYDADGKIGKGGTDHMFSAVEWSNGWYDYYPSELYIGTQS